MTPIMDGIKLRILTQEKDKTQHTKKKRYKAALLSLGCNGGGSCCCDVYAFTLILILNAAEAPSTYK